MRRLLTQCPSCGGDLIVTEQSCTRCDTVVSGRYTGCTFCRLPDDDLRFLEIFVSCRGNIKEMERETGLGYWTIRGHLDEVIERLRLSQQATVPGTNAPTTILARRRDILAAVERGDLDVSEAERMLVDLAQR